MGHCVYTGSFRELEIRWMEVVSELKRGDPLFEVNVLVGSNILASYIKRLFADHQGAAANIRFHTFLDLVERICAVSKDVPRKPRIPRLGASIVLADILAAHSPSVFAPLSGYPGFRDALLNSFRDLRDAEISPSELEEFVRTSGGASERRDQMQGFADLYRRFRYIMQRFRDVDEDFRTAIRNSYKAKQTLGLGPLLIYGIYDVTGQQSRLLTALKDSLDMIYFIPFVEQNVSEFASPFLKARLDELKVETAQLQPRIPASSLERLAASSFGFMGSRECGNGKCPEPDGSFALISAPGESRAAVEIVREVMRAVRDGTINGFYESAIILRQPESDISILTEMFRLRGIRYFVHGGRSFAERPLSKAVVALSNLESNSFSREAVLHAMELVAAALPEASASTWDVQTWKSLTNDPRFLAGIASWDAGTEALIHEARRDLKRAEAPGNGYAEEEDAERDAKSPAIAKKYLESSISLRHGWMLLRQASAEWPPRLPWQKWALFLEQNLIPILGDSEDWHSFSSVLDQIGNLEILREIEIQDSTDTTTDGLVSVDKLRAALIQSLSNLTYPEGRFQRSGVNILPLSAARGLRFPLVIIPGLDEGRFPAKLRQDPLLLDSERQRLTGLPLKSMRIEEEKLLFDMAARSAEKRLVLLTSRLDESSDRERIPSQFFLSVAAAVRGTVASMRELTQGAVAGFRSVSLDNPAPAEDEGAVDEGEIRLRLVTAKRKSAQSALLALAQLDPLRINRPLAYDRARWSKRLTAFDGYIADPGLVRLIARKVGVSAGPVSASRLEEYAKCPYYFFLKRVMGLDAWKEQGHVETMDPLERGFVIHSILESFLKDLCGEAFLNTSDRSLQQSLELQAQKKLEGSQPAGIPGLLWEIERDTLLIMLKNWLVFEKKRALEGMLPASLERVFGEFTPKEQFPVFRLHAGKYTVDFRGRIDRIDLSIDGKRARVIDYKTGTLPESMNRSRRTPLMSGERIQLVVYRGALSVLGEFNNVEIIEGEYLYLQPRDARIAPNSYTNEELEQASKALPGTLEALCNGLESGVFFARTRGMVRPSGHCDFCEYLPICGKDRVQREERKADDPVVRNLLGILELPS